MKNKLREKRLDVALTQVELAYLLEWTVKKLSRVERGLVEPTKEEKKKAAELFNTSVDEMFPPESEATPSA